MANLKCRKINYKYSETKEENLAFSLIDWSITFLCWYFKTKSASSRTSKNGMLRCFFNPRDDGCDFSYHLRALDWMR